MPLVKTDAKISKMTTDIEISSFHLLSPQNSISLQLSMYVHLYMASISKSTQEQFVFAILQFTSTLEIARNIEIIDIDLKFDQ